MDKWVWGWKCREEMGVEVMRREKTVWDSEGCDSGMEKVLDRKGECWTQVGVERTHCQYLTFIDGLEEVDLMDERLVSRWDRSVGFGRARVVKILSGNDFFVEVVPKHVPHDVVGALEDMQWSAESKEEGATQSCKVTAAMEVLRKEGFVLKSDGLVTRSFRVTLDGVYVPPHSFQNFHAKMFLFNCLLGRAVSITIIGNDVAGRAVVRLTAKDFPHSLSYTMLRQGLAWYQQPLEQSVTSVLQEAQKLADARFPSRNAIRASPGVPNFFQEINELA